MISSSISEDMAGFLSSAFGEQAVLDLDAPRLRRLKQRSKEPLGPSWERNLAHTDGVRYDLRHQGRGISFQTVLIDRRGNLELRNCLPRPGGLLLTESVRRASNGNFSSTREVLA